MSFNQMSLTIQTIKRNWVYMLLLVAIAIFVHRFCFAAKKKTSYQVFPVANGWGYRILLDNTVFVQQEQIPAVQGFAFFQTKQDAANTAKLVIQKMKKYELPMVTVTELDSMGVKY